METVTAPSSRFAVLGVNDDRDFCMCCGRDGLKRVVWIEDTETGDVRHFGTTCATQPVKGFPKGEIQKAIRAADKAREEAARAAYWAKQEEIGKRAYALTVELYATRGGAYVAATYPLTGKPYQKIADLALYESCKAEAYRSVS